MRIVVCVKHVPDISSQRGFDSASRTVRTTEDSTLNEVDENAVEAALQFAEAAEQGAEVIALTMAPDIAVDAARRALQLGAGRGVHISDEALAGADYTVTARALAAAVRAEGSVDVVVTGMTALDGLGSVVPSLLAAELGWPQATVAREAELRDGAVTAPRDVDGVAQTCRRRPACAQPCAGSWLLNGAGRRPPWHARSSCVLAPSRPPGTWTAWPRPGGWTCPASSRSPM